MANQNQRPDATIHRAHLEQFLKSRNGKFVGLDFIKKDQSVRPMNGRLGVKCHLRGGTSTVSSLDMPYLVMYDLKQKGYRAVNLATVGRVRANKVHYAVIG